MKKIFITSLMFCLLFSCNTKDKNSITTAFRTCTLFNEIPEKNFSVNETINTLIYNDLSNGVGQKIIFSQLENKSAEPTYLYIHFTISSEKKNEHFAKSELKLYTYKDGKAKDISDKIPQDWIAENTTFELDPHSKTILVKEFKLDKISGKITDTETIKKAVWNAGKFEVKDVAEKQEINSTSNTLAIVVINKEDIDFEQQMEFHSAMKRYLAKLKTEKNIDINLQTTMSPEKTKELETKHNIEITKTIGKNKKGVFLYKPGKAGYFTISMVMSDVKKQMNEYFK